MKNNLNFYPPISYGGVMTADIFHDYNRFYKNIEPSYILKEYSIKNSPRPEMLSYMLYGTVEYYWILLLINKIYDPYYDWVMSDNAVHEYARQKYEYVGGVNKVAYHVNADGERFWNVVEDKNTQHWYDSRDLIKRYPQYIGAMIPVTNIEHEIEENEKRRVINIVRPNDIKRFASDLRRQMEDANGRGN
ncbi:MAG: baseplate wedge protein 53 [Bacilli bacterium]